VIARASRSKFASEIRDSRSGEINLIRVHPRASLTVREFAAFSRILVQLSGDGNFVSTIRQFAMIDGVRIITKNIFFWEDPRNRARLADFNWRLRRNHENNNRLLCPESLSLTSHRESPALITEREKQETRFNETLFREMRAKHV